MSYIVSCYDTPKLNYMTYHLLENNNHKTHFRVVYVNLTNDDPFFYLEERVLLRLMIVKRKEKNLKNLILEGFLICIKVSYASMQNLFVTFISVYLWKKVKMHVVNLNK